MATQINMPKLSDTMEEGTIISWFVDEGDSIKSGDALAEVETDKAVMDLQAYTSGILLKKVVEAGQAVAVGQLIAVVGEAGEDISAFVPGEATKVEKAPESILPPVSVPAAGKEAPPVAAEEIEVGRLRFSPVAKKLAEERGIDLAKLRGTGPGGRIIERDVPDAAPAGAHGGTPSFQEARPAVAATPGETRDMSQMRKAIVRQMAKSKAPVPHFYLTMEIAMEKALEVVAEVKETHPEIKLGINDLIMKAAAEALKKYPQINSSYVEENKVKMHKSIDIGIAVGLEDGLITPVVKDCGSKTARGIAAESKTLVERARKRALQPEEYTGSTFTITNLGMFGVENFVAVINPPEAAILAIGAVREAPVVENGHLKVGKRMLVTISCDHRVVDGMQGAQFLQELKRLMENPVGLVV